jgi:ferredoxin
LLNRIAAVAKQMIRNRMRIRIDRTKCTGNARCWAIAPDVFPLDEDGYIAVAQVDVPNGMQAIARRAARACPERVIEVVED